MIDRSDETDLIPSADELRKEVIDRIAKTIVGPED